MKFGCQVGTEPKSLSGAGFDRDTERIDARYCMYQQQRDSFRRQYMQKA